MMGRSASGEQSTSTKSTSIKSTSSKSATLQEDQQVLFSDEEPTHYGSRFIEHFSDDESNSSGNAADDELDANTLVGDLGDDIFWARAGSSIWSNSSRGSESVDFQSQLGNEYEYEDEDEDEDADGSVGCSDALWKCALITSGIAVIIIALVSIAFAIAFLFARIYGAVGN